MLQLINVQRNANGSMAEQRMQALEEIAEYAVTRTTPTMQMNYVNIVERYHASAIRQDDLIELP